MFGARRGLMEPGWRIAWGGVNACATPPRLRESRSVRRGQGCRHPGPTIMARHSRERIALISFFGPGAFGRLRAPPLPGFGDAAAPRRLGRGHDLHSFTLCFDLFFPSPAASAQTPSGGPAAPLPSGGSGMPPPRDDWAGAMAYTPLAIEDFMSAAGANQVGGTSVFGLASPFLCIFHSCSRSATRGPL